MRTLLSLALLALALPASAQTTFGVKLGINAATVSSSDDEQLGLTENEIPGLRTDKQARLGFVGGLTADVPLSPVLSFRPEILYTQKGYAVRTQIDGDVLEDEDFDGTLTLKIDYVEVPLLLAYRFPSRNALDVTVEAGPTLAYKLDTGFGCGGDFDDIGECDEDGFDDDDDGVEDFDLGGALGVTIGSGPFGVGLRYTNSILSIATDESSDGGDFSVRNQVFSVTGHYRFGGR